MTSEKLYGILRLIDTLENKLSVQNSLDAIVTALTNLVSQPAVPQHQSALASALQTFEQAVMQMNDMLSPSQRAVIKAMGGEEYFDPLLYEKIKTAVQTNAMTPAVARDFVQDLASRRANFLSLVRNAKQALEGLKLKDADLEPGSADVAFLIPREIFKNQLGPFATELKFINRLIEHYSEAITGEVSTPELEQLSSSIPTVAIMAAIPVLSTLGIVVNKFLEAWERIEKIRKMRADLKDMGLKGAALDQLTEEMTTTVEEVVEESTELVMSHYKGEDGRRSELESGVKQDTKRLFGQIERGLTVEFRARANGKDDDTGNDKLLGNITDLSARMRFPEVPREPILLGSGELLEGELKVAKHTKKTTTQKTTTRKPVTRDGDAAN